MRSGPHLQRNWGCSATELASCLHPQVELSNIFDSLFRTSPLRLPMFIFQFSILSFTFPQQTRESTQTQAYKVSRYALKRTRDLCRLSTPHFRLWPNQNREVVVLSMNAYELDTPQNYRFKHNTARRSPAHRLYTNLPKTDM